YVYCSMFYFSQSFLHSLCTHDFIISLSFVFFISFFLLLRPPPRSPLFPYTTLFRSASAAPSPAMSPEPSAAETMIPHAITAADRSEEHTSELQSHLNLVCRLLLEKKKKKKKKKKKIKQTQMNTTTSYKTTNYKE